MVRDLHLGGRQTRGLGLGVCLGSFGGGEGLQEVGVCRGPVTQAFSFSA